MKAKTRQKIEALYFNWTRPRQDYGLPLNLADHLHNVRQVKRGESALTLPLMAEALGLPLSYMKELAAALDEGVTDEELAELRQVCVKRREPGEE